MKLQTLRYGLILLSLAVACSKGPQGDIGPQGKDGALGTNGPVGTVGSKGATGDIGNSNVVYTEWATPNFNEPIDALENRKQFNEFDIPFPLFTQEVLSNSQVFIYAKNRSLTFEDNTFKLKENIHEVGSNINTSYYLFPGRSGLSINDYGTHSVSISPLLRPNFLSIGIHVLRLGPGALNVTTTVPEMANKTPAFYRDFMKDLIKYRVVIVKGNVAGRMAAINWKNYAEVKAALNLKD